jgi:hypothetical protein
VRPVRRQQRWRGRPNVRSEEFPVFPVFPVAVLSVEAAKRRKIIIGISAGCFVELPKM